MLNMSHQCLTFADDVTILDRTKHELQKATINLEAAAEYKIRSKTETKQSNRYARKHQK